MPYIVMNRLIPILVIGFLAFVLGSKSSDVNLETSESGSVLSAGFPPGNVPINPKRENHLKEAPITLGGFKASDSQVKRRIIKKIPRAQPYPVSTSGNIYKYQVPLDDENLDEQIEAPYSKDGYSGQRSAADPDLIHRQSGGQYLHQQDDGNNGQESTKEVLSQENTDYIKTKAKPLSKDFSSIQDLQFEKSKKKYTSQIGNQSQVIQVAGTGFHDDIALAHPEGHYDNGHHGIINGHDGINNGHDVIVGPHHEIVGHEQEVGYGHGHDAHDDGYHLGPQHKSHSKPLKPSVVHRDPHDTFDHHDKIRTQDKDHLHEVHDHKGHNDGYGHGYEDHNEHGYADKGFKPYLYDMYKVPECAYKNKHYYNLTFCLEDHAYPLESVLWAIHQAGLKAHHLLSDVTYQSADNLVTGLTRAEEEGYTYKHYFGGTHSQHTHLEQYKPPYHGYKYSADYFKKGGYICPSDIYYGRPKRAMNTYGKWKVIVNVDHIPKPHYEHGNVIHKREIAYGHKGHGIIQKPYTQTIRLEQCIYANAPCSYIDSHYHSRCIQKHNFVRLVSWTHEEGLHVDTFKMPIACSCHIRQPIHFYHESGHHVESHGHVVPPVNVYEHHTPAHAGKK